MKLTSTIIFVYGPTNERSLLFIPVRPLSVLVLHKPRQMVAGEEYTIQCEVNGSRPKATVTWTRDNRIFRRGKVRSHVILLGVMVMGSSSLPELKLFRADEH